MRTHRNSNSENLEQKKSTKLNHDRPDLRQPRMGVSHKQPMYYSVRFRIVLSFSLRLDLLLCNQRGKQSC